ncbi:hypothetical protein GW17_00028025 [Ensete ventricosum]|nr:hypothetical protein GW17_00028025 [Ensete ventricosum]
MYRLVWRYISVRQVTGMRIARYWAVPSKIDRRRSISAVGGRLKKKSTVDGRLREKSTVGGRLRRKREEEEEKKKKRGEERIPRPPAIAARGSLARRRRPWGERSRRLCTVHTARYGSHTDTDNMSVHRYGSVVQPKSTVDGRLREKSTVSGRLREKKKEEEEKKKEEK